MQQHIEIDHNGYPKHLRGLPMASLRFIIKDAREALEAQPDSPKAGYYQDEINYAAMEIRRREEEEWKKVNNDARVFFREFAATADL